MVSSPDSMEYTGPTEPRVTSSSYSTETEVPIEQQCRLHSLGITPNMYVERLCPHASTAEFRGDSGLQSKPQFVR